jgi:hypothetical protein
MSETPRPAAIVSTTAQAPSGAQCRSGHQAPLYQIKNACHLPSTGGQAAKYNRLTRCVQSELGPGLASIGFPATRGIACPRAPCRPTPRAAVSPGHPQISVVNVDHAPICVDRLLGPPITGRMQQRPGAAIVRDQEHCSRGQYEAPKVCHSSRYRYRRRWADLRQSSHDRATVRERRPTHLRLLAALAFLVVVLVVAMAAVARRENKHDHSGEEQPPPALLGHGSDRRCSDVRASNPGRTARRIIGLVLHKKRAALEDRGEAHIGATYASSSHRRRVGNFDEEGYPHVESAGRVGDFSS